MMNTMLYYNGILLIRVLDNINAEILKIQYYHKAMVDYNQIY